MMEIYAKELTELWWERCRADFLLFVSELVLEECGAGDPNLAQRRLALLSGIAVLRPNGAMLELAKALVEARPMPAKEADDVLHVATATVYGCEYLLTWNCRHIANAEIRRAAGRIGADTGMNYR